MNITLNEIFLVKYWMRIVLVISLKTENSEVKKFIVVFEKIYFVIMINSHQIII
jgi:hypothetical protein